VFIAVRGEANYYMTGEFCFPKDYYLGCKHLTPKGKGHSFSHSLKIQLLKCKFSLWNSPPKKPQTLHHCHHFELYKLCQATFCGVIPSKTFCPKGFQHSRLYNHVAALNCIIMGHTIVLNGENDSNEDWKVDIISWKKYILLTLWRCKVSCKLLSFPPISRWPDLHLT